MWMGVINGEGKESLFWGVCLLVFFLKKIIDLGVSVGFFHMFSCEKGTYL